MLHEWPLILYTLLGQAAAGLFLGAVLVRPSAETGVPTKRPILVAGILLAGAVLLSLAHLGSPMGAFRAISNLGSSWLAREILMTGIFGLLLLASFVRDSRYLHGLTALAGIGMVGSMSMLYQSTIIPAWTTSYTMISFLAVTLVAGGLLLLIVLPGQAATSPTGSGMAAAGIVLQLAALPLYLGSLGTGLAPARESLAVLMGAMAPLLITHVVLITAAAAVLALIWNRKLTAFRFTLLAAMLGLSGVALARVFFFAAAFPIRVG